MTVPRPDLAVVELREWLRHRPSHTGNWSRNDEWADALDAILAEREALEAEREWRPIETAPRDGVHILVTDIDHPEILTVVSWVHGQWKYENPKGSITHWLHLPAAPQPKGPDDE